MLSTHQKTISSQGHHQTVNMLQEGAWESHSNSQHFTERAWQHCQPTIQNHIYYNNWHFFKGGNMLMTVIHSWTFMKDYSLPSGTGIPSVLFMVHNSARFGDE